MELGERRRQSKMLMDGPPEDELSALGEESAPLDTGILPETQDVNGVTTSAATAAKAMCSNMDSKTSTARNATSASISSIVCTAPPPTTPSGGLFFRNWIPTLGTAANSPSLVHFSAALDAVLATPPPRMEFTALTGMRSTNTPLVDAWMHPDTGDLLLLSARNLEAFSLLPQRPLKLLDAVLLPRAAQTAAAAPPTPLTPTIHIGSTNAPGVANAAAAVPPAALHAGYIPNLDELAIVHADNKLRFYSTRPGTMGSLLRAVPLEMDPVSIAMLPNSRSLLVAGAITVARIPHVQIDGSAPDIVRISDNPISTVTILPNRDAFLVSTTGPVRIQEFSFDATKPPSLAFATHSSTPVITLTALSATMLLTASPSDSTLALYHTAAARNLVRIAVPFPPTCLAETDDPFLFMLGGDDGSVVLFRVILQGVTPLLADLRIVATVNRTARRAIGKICKLFLVREEIIAVAQTGSISRWSISNREIPLNETPDVDLGEASRTRIAAKWRWLVEAQRALANVLSDSTGLHEAEKDGLVESFQSAQQTVQEAAKELDDQLERTLTEIGRKQAHFELKGIGRSLDHCSSSWRDIDINSSFDAFGDTEEENVSPMRDTHIWRQAANRLFLQKRVVAIRAKAHSLEMLESALRARLQGILREAIDQRMTALSPDEEHYEATKSIVEDAWREISAI